MLQNNNKKVGIKKRCLKGVQKKVCVYCTHEWYWHPRYGRRDDEGRLLYTGLCTIPQETVKPFVLKSKY